MRNLKKFLALVLAMMMTLSLMVTVNASNKVFDDSEDVTPAFDEGVLVLSGLGIIKGVTDDTFAPDHPVTRAQMAAFIYRIATGDVDDSYVNNYAGYNTKFTDVDNTAWYAGYIGYCENAGYIQGYGNNTFGPNKSVTGYQALAMILRAMGYNEPGHNFTGSGWQTQAASTATDRGMMVNVDKTAYKATLSQPATRELVSELVFQGFQKTRVQWTAAYGYQTADHTTTPSTDWYNVYTPLATKFFKLDCTDYKTIDKWGRPGYQWYSGKESNVVATIAAEPVVTYDTTTDECDLAHDVGIKDSATFDLYVNGDKPVTNSYLVVATDRVTKVGGQGRVTEVYRDLPGLKDRVVMIDTFLAQVTNVTTAVKDAAGHLIVPATLTLNVYDKTDATGNAPSVGRTVTRPDDSNWEYSKGDMVLLNAYTDHDYSESKHETDARNATLKNASGSAAAPAAHSNPERAAFEYERVAVKGYACLDEDPTYTTAKRVNELEYADVLHVANSEVAKQNVVYWNSAKHDVGGTEHPDQLDLFLDVAGTKTGTDFTWYYDDNNNIIGIGDAVKSNYGVITSIYSAFKQGDGTTTGEAVAKAHVKYSDGTEGDVIIDNFVVNANDVDGGHSTAKTAMRKNSTANSLELIPIYDFATDTGKVMLDGATPATMTSDIANKIGYLYVSPVASVNKNSEGLQAGLNVNGYDGSGTGASTNKFYGIIEQNLFKFVSSGDGTMTAIEVAGTNTGAAASRNDTIFVGHNNANVGTSTAAEMKKNIGVLTVDSVSIRVNNNTQIMLKEGDKINVYNGLNALTGDVNIAKMTEVDWVDNDNDGIAEVLYTQCTVKGNITHNLFYYTDGAAQWNGATGKGTMVGYLDGEQATVTFSNEKLFYLVKNSVSDYEGHIFAVEITNGEVTNLFGEGDVTASANSFAERFAADTAVWLNSGDDSSNKGVMKNTTTPLKNIDLTMGISTAAYNKGGAVFVTDAKYGNDYTENTKVWADDVDGVAGTYANGTVKVGGTTYYLGTDSKIVGELAYLNLGSYTSHVTVVFESTGNIIDSIYVYTLETTTEIGENVVIGDDVEKAPASADDADKLTAWLKGHRNGVYQSTTTKMGTTSADKSTMLYFPFSNPASGNVTLEIRNDSGDLRYTESHSSVTAGMKVLSFDFMNATAAAGGGDGAWVGTATLGAGTYSYAIYVSGGTTPVSEGTFTLVLK